MLKVEIKDKQLNENLGSASWASYCKLTQSFFPSTFKKEVTIVRKTINEH